MKKLIFLDTETTGVEEKDRLIQLCYRIDGNSYVEYFNSGVPISFMAMATHHITEKEIKNRPSLDDSIAAKDILQGLLNDGVLVAHNAKFDIGMLEKEGLKIREYICTLKVAKRLFDLDCYKLQYLRYYYDLNVEAKAHDAAGDVAVLEALFNELLKTTTIEDMIVMTKNPILLKKIQFGKYKGQEFKEIDKGYLEWLNGQSDLDEDLKYTLKHYLK